MNYSDLKKLKSGSDVRGIASEITSPVTLTDEVIYAIVRAFSAWHEKSAAKSPRLYPSVTTCAYPRTEF